MHLKQLKLAGFKSFVDPTVIPFPSQLLAILGPNGCGKSNVIDAVRWVLGESSAKNLRGESMSDVIFNGSSSRKPVGQAQVELIFDNSLGRLSGQFASFQELSIKRVVTRAGDSAYYLNGSRCRRRDITDLFLGTGAGAHGYSIIGQGTISKLIEARPEELRAYFEEAAGVSKYKDRRRETLQRMTMTHEHLARVQDIRLELDKQLERLSRQAKAAEKFQQLKEAERFARGLIYALKWQDLSDALQDKKNGLNALGLKHAAYQVEEASLLALITSKRQAYHLANDDMAQCQAVYYQIGTEIARIEQALLQKIRENERIEKESQQLKDNWLSSDERLKTERIVLQTCEQDIVLYSQQLDSFKNALQGQQTIVAQQLKQQQCWDEDWQSLQTTLNTIRREADLQRLQLQQHETERQQLLIRADKIYEAQGDSAQQELDQVICLLEDELSAYSEALSVANCRVQEMLEKQSDAAVFLSLTEQKVHQSQDTLATLKSDYAALHASLSASVEVNEADLPLAWRVAPRAFEQMQVQKPWQRVCELVLGVGLHGIVIDSLDSLWDTIETQQNNLVFSVADAHLPTRLPYPTLRDKITGFCPSWWARLETVYTAIDLNTALNWLPTLAPHESIVTPDGLWLGTGWLIVSRQKQDDAQGLLERQARFLQVSQDVVLAAQVLSEAIAARDDAHQHLQCLNDDLSHYKQLATEHLSTYRQTQLVYEERVRQREALKVTLDQLSLDACEIHLRLETLAALTIRLSQAHENTCQIEQEWVSKEISLQKDKQHWVQQLHLAQKELEGCRNQFHECELVLMRQQQYAQHCLANIVREEALFAELEERIEQLASLSACDNEPDIVLKATLVSQCEAHAKLDASLIEARANIQALEVELSQAEKKQREIEGLGKACQEQLQQLFMDEQALTLRAQSQLEALSELGLTLDHLEASLAANPILSVKEVELIEIVDKIKRLGAINLLAIEEYESALHRQQHLDAQYNDLTKALQTLEKAIAQMDKETSLRLRQTFDEVNMAFQTLFPRLFGGGHAQLLLTCDNLLEAGVVVMAQPPGKRNSTIQLLSGGEKAMTAVALVFAIFQQNPSPFCMLDEVDAPLDEANVGRFCDLVKEMSQVVQFLFVTHNKATMMLAEHLIGVTMREPGVSRVVAVDIEQALSIGE